MHYCRLLSVIIAVFCTTLGSFCQAVKQPLQVQTIDQKLTEQFRQTDLIFSKFDTTVSPGCALSVMRDGNILYERGYGMADLDHNIPITPQTVFHVASISKQFTATAILMLSIQGKVSLDEDIHKYLPELPDYGVKIAVSDLLHHTSGIRDQWALLDLAGWRINLDLITDQDVLGLLYKQKELNFPPGQRFLYSNSGYTLLAQIVQRASGQSLRQFTSAQIFKPLGMNDTRFRDDHAEIVNRDAYGYSPTIGSNVYKISITNFDTVGATGLLTTVEDLARWDENFYDHRVGGDALNALQLKPGKLNSGVDATYVGNIYASGLALGKYRGLRIVDHSGADAGYRADLIRFPDKHFSIACLCNRSDVATARIVLKVADIFLAGDFTGPSPEILDVSAKSIKISQGQLDSYKGLYWSSEVGRPIRIEASDDQLTVAGPDGKSQRLLPVNDTEFRMENSIDTYVFTHSKKGDKLTIAFQHGLEPVLEYNMAEPFRPTVEQLDSYAGMYVSDEVDTKLQFVISGSAIVLKRAKLPTDAFQPTIQDSFQDAMGSNVHFQRDTEGKIDGFVFDMGRITNMKFNKLRKPQS